MHCNRIIIQKQHNAIANLPKAMIFLDCMGPQLQQMKLDSSRGGANRELFLVSYFKTSYFGELFLCKLDDLK